jgi:arsenate reductase (thioredoxin)
MAVLRPHLALTVTDVERAVPFYEALFGVCPQKRRPGYAKFSVTEPAFNFTLTQDERSEVGAFNHGGIQVASTDDVLAAKSQALFDQAAEGRHSSESAGSDAESEGHLHPQVIAVMSELGVDLSDRKPQKLTNELAQQADVVVTMGCGDSCPYIPGKRYIDWDLPDPKGQPVATVRAIRDEIRTRIEQLLAELDNAAAAPRARPLRAAD